MRGWLLRTREEVWPMSTPLSSHHRSFDVLSSDFMYCTRWNAKKDNSLWNNGGNKEHPALPKPQQGTISQALGGYSPSAWYQWEYKYSRLNTTGVFTHFVFWIHFKWLKCLQSIHFNFSDYFIVDWMAFVDCLCLKH